MNPDLNDFAPRVGFAFAATPKTAVRGGIGTSYVHYTGAGSGDILAINAPQALFVSVPQTGALARRRRTSARRGSRRRVATRRSTKGFPTSLVTTFDLATDNITYVPKNTRDSYVESYFVSVQQQISNNTLLDVAYVGNHGLKLQGLVNGNQKNPSLGFARPYGNWPTSLVYELPVGRGRRFLPGANGLVDTVLGGWQVSAINTAQAGTPFHLTYTPGAAQQVSPTPGAAQQVSPQISANYRGANAYRPNVVAGQRLQENA